MTHRSRSRAALAQRKKKRDLRFCVGSRRKCTAAIIMIIEERTLIIEERTIIIRQHFYIFLL